MRVEVGDAPSSLDFFAPHVGDQVIFPSTDSYSRRIDTDTVKIIVWLPECSSCSAKAFSVAEVKHLTKTGREIAFSSPDTLTVLEERFDKASLSNVILLSGDRQPILKGKGKVIGTAACCVQMGKITRVFEGPKELFRYVQAMP